MVLHSTCVGLAFIRRCSSLQDLLASDSTFVFQWLFFFAFIATLLYRFVRHNEAILMLKKRGSADH